jgi:hypothetical protein
MNNTRHNGTHMDAYLLCGNATYFVGFSSALLAPLILITQGGIKKRK